MSFITNREWKGFPKPVYSITRAEINTVNNTFGRHVGGIVQDVQSDIPDFSPRRIDHVERIYGLTESLTHGVQSENYLGALLWGIGVGRIVCEVESNYELTDSERIKWATIAANSFQIAGESAFALGLPRQAVLSLYKAVHVLEEVDGRNIIPEHIDKLTSALVDSLNGGAQFKDATCPPLNKLAYAVKGNVNDLVERNGLDRFLFKGLVRFRSRGTAHLIVPDYSLK